jgi:predicted nucleic acid-binding protein
MIGRFAVTSYLVALASADDTWHLQAVDHAGAWRGRVVTTDFVLVELANWLTRWKKRAAFAPIVEQLRADPKVLVHTATRQVFDAGYDLFRRRPDKDWSMTDCISFFIMEQEGVTEALSTDHHFEQAGFTILLK